MTLDQNTTIAARILLEKVSPPSIQIRDDDVQPKPAGNAKATKAIAATQAYLALIKPTLETATAETTRTPTFPGLRGQSDIIYWPFQEVDQAALLLAEWPENLVVAPWPSEQPVTVEVWVNPDGGLANIKFPQDDLPVPVKMALFDSINQYGFKPAIKDGQQVGNHRLLEILLTETSVPALAIR